MKKEQVNSILINQAKRRSTVLAYVGIILIVFSLMVLSFLLYTRTAGEKYVSYNEQSNIDYKVYYKENEFFDEKYLESNKQYIASLIDQINADFKYEIALEDVDADYKYSYRIEADVIVKDKDTKNIFYETTDVLLEKVEREATSKEVSIKENIIIDYDEYNNKIKKLVNVYDLDRSESFLNINMYVSVVGSCEDFINNPEKEKTVTLSIPLTEDTIAIDFMDDIVNSSNNVMLCDSGYVSNGLFLIFSIGFALVDVCLIIAVIRYEYKTRTAETIYEKEMKKILNNYGSSIQILGNEFEFGDYQLLKIETFNDMLEIGDKLRQPILMKENNEKTGAYFLIPSNTNLLYVYRLKVSDIEKEINKKNKNI